MNLEDFDQVPDVDFTETEDKKTSKLKKKNKSGSGFQSFGTYFYNQSQLLIFIFPIFFRFISTGFQSSYATL